MYLVLKASLYDKDLNLIKEESIGGYDEECTDSSFYGALGKASKYCKNRTLKQYLPNVTKLNIITVSQGEVWFDMGDFTIAVKIDFLERRPLTSADIY